MDQDRQKWVNLSYICAAALTGYIVFSLSNMVAGKYDLETRMQHIDLILRGVSVFVGLVLFLIMYRHQKVNQFMNEVIIELSRVTWPMRPDTAKATMVVIIMVLISGLFLGGMDTFWSWLLKWVL